jgi:hypothetical protein
MGTLHEDVFTVMTVSGLILLRIRNVSNTSCRENQNTHFMQNNFISENRAVYETLSKNIVEPERPQTTIWCMCIACWISKQKPAPMHTHPHTHAQIFHTYCFSTATIFSWRRLSVTLCVRWLPFLAGMRKAAKEPQTEQPGPHTEGWICDLSKKAEVQSTPTQHSVTDLSLYVQSDVETF